MSKIKLWENTHFDKIIAVYDDGTEEEIGYINDDGERIYYADDTTATPPRQFRSDWNQRQYDAYKKKQTDAENNNGRSPSFPDLIQKHSHNVVAGAGNLLNSLQKYQQQFPINRTGFNSVMFDKNAISHESVSFGYSNFTDEAPPPTNYRNLIRTGGRGVPGGLRSNLNDEIILKTIIVDEAGNELPFGTIITQEEIFHSEKKWDRREAIRYNSDLWYLRESLKKGYIRSGDTEILKEFVIDPNKNEKQKNRATITVIYEKNGGYWKESGTYNLVYIDEYSYPIYQPPHIDKIDFNRKLIEPKFNFPQISPLIIPPFQQTIKNTPPIRRTPNIPPHIQLNIRNPLPIQFLKNNDAISGRNAAIDRILRDIANNLRENPNLIVIIIGNSNAPPDPRGLDATTGNTIRGTPIENSTIRALMIARARTIERILINEYGVNPNQIRVRVGRTNTAQTTQFIYITQ